MRTENYTLRMGWLWGTNGFGVRVSKLDGRSAGKGLSLGCDVHWEGCDGSGKFVTKTM